MDPWRPEYKPMYDFLENLVGAIKLAALWAVFMAIIAITL